MRRLKILLLVVTALPSSIAQGQGSAVGTAPKTPILVELFTSEGCSSCPPADTLLQQLDATQPLSETELIVLSEHVDYWDREGWKDPYSLSSVTERQSEYVRALGLQSPYTPQFIVDGIHQFNMANTSQLLDSMRKAMADPKVSVKIGSPVVKGGISPVVRARIEIDGVSEKRNADVYAAVALDHAESQVLHGENGGKHLTHVAVVEQFKRVGKLEKGSAFTRDLEFKVKQGVAPTDLRLVVFVQESGPGRVVGAACRKMSD